MKLNISKVMKPVVAALLVSTMVSSCVVRTKTPRRQPPPKETIIIKP